MTKERFNQYPLGEGLDLVLGLGASGLSCARFLHRGNRQMRIADTRHEPPFAEQLKQELPDIDIRLGEFSTSLLRGVGRVIASPGIPNHAELLQEARRQNIPVISDIQLFGEVAPAPVLAITGSNGKSTVTSWLAHVLNATDRVALAGGNLGVPALQLLDEEIPDYYVLELSSFQLERTESLNVQAAAILNIGTDHIDHHGSVKAYRDAKWRILRHAQHAVLFAPLAHEAYQRPQDLRQSDRVRVYGSATADAQPSYTLAQKVNAETDVSETYLCRNGQELLAASALRVVGEHNCMNALAVIAMADVCGVPWSDMIEGLTSFTGLPHRMEWVGEQGGVTWVNDSKGTNVDATIAAIGSIKAPIVLIAGGDGKGADFKMLANALVDPDVNVKAVVVIGVDGGRIEDAVAGRLDVVQAASMEQAVLRAAGIAEAGDTVLLSPACASYDMFDNYQHRGQTFACALRELV